MKFSSVLRNLNKCRTAINHRDLPEHRSLVVEEYGQPVDKVILKTRRPEDVLPKELGSKQVLVEHLAACVNPSDISQIRGIYGIKLPLPGIAGNEGVTRVKSVGSEVTHLKPGDHALGVTLRGYWQSYSVQDSQDLYKIDNELDISIAAQMKVNPCTAYNMIKDAGLKPGDAIVQNGANSAVGVYAIQLAKLWGYRTINVIRDRPNKDELVAELKGYGADYVVTEAELVNAEKMAPILKDTGKPKLSLDCVGGKSTANCQRLLDRGGSTVVYGAMAGQPLTLSPGSMIFKQYRVSGFWVSNWYHESERSEISKLLVDVGDMFKKGVLKPKTSTMVNFEDRNLAFSASSPNIKYLFSINKP